MRQDLVWSKPNPMPESVRGWSFNTEGELRRGSWRHTRAHEYVFMLVKGMQYWSDQEAVREASGGQGGSAADFARDSKEDLVPGQVRVQHRIEREGDEEQKAKQRKLTPERKRPPDIDE